VEEGRKFPVWSSEGGMKLPSVEQRRMDKTFQCGEMNGDEASGRNVKCQEGITQRRSRDGK
jgi:hypothetical protein